MRKEKARRRFDEKNRQNSQAAMATTVGEAFSEVTESIMPNLSFDKADDLKDEAIEMETVLAEHGHKENNVNSTHCYSATEVSTTAV